MTGLATAPDGYYTFGGGSAEVTRGKAGPIATRYDDGTLMAFTVWDSQVGGNQVTDLLDYEGATLPGTVSPIPDVASIDEGLILFYAPQNYAAVFLDRGIPDSVRIALWAREVAASMPVFIDKAQTALDQSTTAATQAAQAETDASAANATAVGVAAQQDQYQGQAATVDELVTTVRLNGTTEIPAWVAPFACTLTYAALVYTNTTLAASDTNYVTATLAKRTAATPGTALVVVAKTSKVTGGEGITAMKAWDFAGASWDPNNSVFAAGDVLTSAVANTGTISPAPGTTPLLVVKYRPAR